MITDSDVIVLSSQEGNTFKITKKEAQLSNLLQRVIADYEELNVPLPEINKSTTQKVVDYLKKWNGEKPPEIDKPIKSSNMKENADEWSANFINSLLLEEIADLSIAANFMEIDSLLDLTCAKFASLGYNKTEEELLKEYGITTPFTDEEKKKIREENPWLESNPEDLK